ncbi:hypothetical protein IQ03_01078 [Gemmobacter caeni]|uniref:Uncharacterized protein n=1 Tax=Gemmobacter caeni TaxID=589035 RepID=A0A2T6B8D7_9RHOB|nr:hypothetical protein [Gemmobacter caeni]PTX52288.1 hypothetical protein C8N34_10266 [Gemmobacter caeni]TWJ02661.1 hypothetical protein IQ03_01078 [Gemmobacter caeni]
MITAPLSTPRTGHLLFSEKLCLMVRVSKVSHDGFSFHVLNGAWDGVVRNGEVLIGDPSFGWAAPLNTDGGETGEAPDPRLGPSDFVQVLSVTRREYDAWYMAAAVGAEKLINRPVTAAPVLTEGPDDEADEEEERPDPVYEVTLRLTVLGQGESARELENWVAGLSLEDLARELDEGELIGASQVIGTSEVPPEDLRARLEEVGNDGSFFERVGAAGKPVPIATRISDLRDQQGWTDGSMEHLAAAFIREAGLERAFLAHLERQAAMENGYSDEPEIM